LDLKGNEISEKFRMLYMEAFNDLESRVEKSGAEMG
jgi:hypothetical protein